MAEEQAGPGSEGKGREGAEGVGRTFRGVGVEAGRALKEFESLPPYESLQVLGGVIPIGVGTLIFVLRAAQVTLAGPLEASAGIFFWIWNLIFGALVLFAFGVFRRSPFNGAVLGGVLGLLLLFGGVSGVIGGALAILGFAWGYWVRSGVRVTVSRPPTTGAD